MQTTAKGFKKLEGSDYVSAAFYGTTGAFNVNVDTLEALLDDKATAGHNHDSAYARKTAVLTDTQSTEKTVALLDNTEYRFGTLTALTATLPETTTYEVYIRFTAGTGVTVSGLTSVIWSGGAPEWVAGNIYEVSIKDGYGVMAAYEVSA